MTKERRGAANALWLAGAADAKRHDELQSFVCFTGRGSIMKSALGAFVCVAAVYAGCSWFVARNLDDSHLEAAANDAGWVAVSEPTVKSPYLQARRPETMRPDL